MKGFPGHRFHATLAALPEDEAVEDADAERRAAPGTVTVTTREGRLHVKVKRRFRPWKERHFRLSTATWDDAAARDAGPCLSMFVRSKNTFARIALAGCAAAPADLRRKNAWGFRVAASVQETPRKPGVFGLWEAHISVSLKPIWLLLGPLIISARVLEIWTQKSLASTRTKSC